MREKIKVEGLVHAPLAVVWDSFTQPEHITKWNHASEDWHCPHAENDLRVGGRFLSRMEAKDGSIGFDFTGTYTNIVPQQHIAYTMDDGRTVDITFTEVGEDVQVMTMFDPESENPEDMQRSGWQAILDSFRKYTESL